MAGDFVQSRTWKPPTVEAIELALQETAMPDAYLVRTKQIVIAEVLRGAGRHATLAVQEAAFIADAAVSLDPMLSLVWLGDYKYWFGRNNQTLSRVMIAAAVNRALMQKQKL